ncbi:MAG: hypothetical protein WD512_20195 [Candidatus Paceibacterota bacterium]
MIYLCLYVSGMIAFAMITSEVTGLRNWYDKFAEQKRIKQSCEWCFSIHLSWIFHVIIYCLHLIDDSLFYYPDLGLILIPLSGLIGFIIYRKSL